MATEDQLNQRRDYVRGHLNEDTIDPDPLIQFGNWLDDAVACEAIDEPLAMTLATSSAAAEPSARIVLLRFFDANGFAFFTNYESHKGRDLSENPRAALVFYWGPLERQVRIEGTVTRTSVDDSDTYFASRPHGSQLGAIASAQSTVADSRSSLDNAFAALAAQYPEGASVPRPAHWGGYRVLPHLIEFWQGGTSRLHDRLEYRRDDRLQYRNDGSDWIVERLWP